MAGMLINNLLYFNDIYCLSYILDYLIGNSIITTFLLIVCSYIFNFCTWHRLIIFRLPAYTAPATDVPVIFDTDGESLFLIRNILQCM